MHVAHLIPAALFVALAGAAELGIGCDPNEVTAYSCDGNTIVTCDTVKSWQFYFTCQDIPGSQCVDITTWHGWCKTTKPNEYCRPAPYGCKTALT